MTEPTANDYHDAAAHIRGIYGGCTRCQNAADLLDQAAAATQSGCAFVAAVRDELERGDLRVGDEVEIIGPPYYNSSCRETGGADIIESRSDAGYYVLVGQPHGYYCYPASSLRKIAKPASAPPALLPVGTLVVYDAELDGGCIWRITSIENGRYWFKRVSDGRVCGYLSDHAMAKVTPYIPRYLLSKRGKCGRTTSEYRVRNDVLEVECKIDQYKFWWQLSKCLGLAADTNMEVK